DDHRLLGRLDPPAQGVGGTSVEGLAGDGEAARAADVLSGVAERADHRQRNAQDLRRRLRDAIELRYTLAAHGGSMAVFVLAVHVPSGHSADEEGWWRVGDHFEDNDERRHDARIAIHGSVVLHGSAPRVGAVLDVSAYGMRFRASE